MEIKKYLFSEGFKKKYLNLKKIILRFLKKRKKEKKLSPFKFPFFSQISGPLLFMSENGKKNILIETVIEKLIGKIQI